MVTYNVGPTVRACWFRPFVRHRNYKTVPSSFNFWVDWIVFSGAGSKRRVVYYTSRVNIGRRMRRRSRRLVQGWIKMFESRHFSYCLYSLLRENFLKKRSGIDIRRSKTFFSYNFKEENTINLSCIVALQPAVLG